ncbi:FAD-binding oxidoreductase [Streptomyces sp. NBC_00872]|uniref:FAD-binding oxidoreductase n=1 Tax=Streptomyces sp. NBC_00872 TaxID=2903686 RepID=UPI0038664B01|nr:FAD-binding protein [Streptomyces sp. NBC_00872]
MTDPHLCADIHQDAVDALASQLTGSLFTPGDPGYTAEAVAFNLRSQHRPLLIVAAADHADVRAAVRFAAAHGLPVGVMATGHQPFPLADRFVLITTRGMGAVEIDAARRTARVEAGAVWGDVVEAARTAGLAPLNGSSPGVGVVGYVLGGGLSPVLGRKYGWAADHVSAIDVVTADGQLRHLTEDSEPELFRSMRGGRSNFGVVTSMEIGLFPVTSFYGGGIFYTAEHTAAVLHAYRDVVGRAPDELTCSVALLNFPPVPEVPEMLRGRFTVHVRIAFLGEAEEAEKLIAPFRTVAPALIDTTGEQPYSAFAAVHQDPTDPAPYEEQGTLLATLPGAAVDTVVARTGPHSGSPVTVLEIRHLGGALGESHVGASVVAAREARFTVWGATVGPPEVTGAGTEVMEALMAELRPWATGRTYQNFASRETTADDIFAPEELERLRRIKKLYDPANLFRVNNHNIAPAMDPVTADAER